MQKIFVPIRSSVPLLLLLMLLFSGCVTFPPSTGYTPATATSDLGYTIKEVSPHIYTAVYHGNINTKGTNAYAYTILAAFEYCIDHQMLGVVAPPQNLSSSETSMALGTNSVPYYHRNGNVTYSNQYYSYPVTNVSPKFETAFECRAQFKDFVGSPDFEALSRELVHDVTKDYRGGLLVKAAKDAHTFQNDDVLIRVNGIRVEQTTDIRQTLEKLDSSKVSVDVIRAQKIIHLLTPIEDLTSRVKEDQTKIVELSCKRIPANEPMSEFEVRPVEIPKICEGILAATAAVKKN